MGRLQILPAAYYDLTPAETDMLLGGVQDKEIETLRQVRLIGDLLRQAHFVKPEPAEKWMPLPGDHKVSRPTGPTQSFAQFMQLAAVMGGQIQEANA